MAQYSLIHGIVLVEEDGYTEDDIQITFFEDLCWGDYITHRLVDRKDNSAIFDCDNVHQPIETMINSFIEGLVYGGNSVEVTQGVWFNDKFFAKKVYTEEP